MGFGVLAAGALAFTLAACAPASGDDNTNETPQTSDGSFVKDDKTLVWGAVPESESTDVTFQPLYDYVELKTGYKVELIELAGGAYPALIEAAISERIDVGSFSGFTYLAAKNGGAKISPITMTITKEGQTPGYDSLAFVRADSDIQTIEDFRGKKVCFVNQNSTSGFLYPSAALLSAGIDPQEDVTPVYAGGHDASIQKVMQGTECDAGFAEENWVENQAIGLFYDSVDEVRVINRQNVPGAPTVLSDNLPSAVKKELTDLFTGLTIADIEAAGIEVTEAFRGYFFEAVAIPGGDSYYDDLRNVCDLTQAASCNP